MTEDRDHQIDDWSTANQRALTTELAYLRELLEQHGRVESQGKEPTFPGGGVQTRGQPNEEREKKEERAAVAALPLPPTAEQQLNPPALDQLCAAFGLTPFERAVLLLCAGIELDSRIAPLCAALQADARRSYPTFALALGVLPDPHWSALRPTGPLRFWRLIEIGTGEGLATSPLRIDERTLHFLAGVDCIDERLFGLVGPLAEPVALAESQFGLAERLAQLWQQSPNAIVHLRSDEVAAAETVAAAACALLGSRPLVLRANNVPATAAEREAFIRLCEREVTFSNSVLLVECDEMDPQAAPALSAFLETIEGPLVVICRDLMPLPHRLLRRLEVNKPTAQEQQALWQLALGEWGRNLNGQINSVTAQFSLGSQAIRAASREVLEELPVRGSEELGTVFWEACRAQSRVQLNDLAQRIEPKSGWEDLVLPPTQLEGLRQIASQVRQRSRVYEDWGFAEKSARGLGISALFSGASGTGKTMAAEVLANELQLDLYRIDLSAMVSKYIGETEKNLRRVFDAAEAGGAILLFDEADALFGKRSEVKDSHDRYANIEVSYLLQRMEAYRGLAILTTNMKTALDKAFLRRLRFVVQFPFPDAAQRVEIWRRVFPLRTPTKGLDLAKLARLNMTGGNIRNIALNATFLAADAEDSVRMNHLLAAARTEYAKLEEGTQRRRDWRLGLKPRNVQVHIEELVLHGFRPGERYDIADAVQRELAGLFESHGVSPSLLQSGAVARLDGGAFKVAARSRTAAVGYQIAKALYGGLHR